MLLISSAAGRRAPSPRPALSLLGVQSEPCPQLLSSCTFLGYPSSVRALALFLARLSPRKPQEGGIGPVAHSGFPVPPLGTAL